MELQDNVAWLSPRLSWFGSLFFCLGLSLGCRDLIDFDCLLIFISGQVGEANDLLPDIAAKAANLKVF